MAIRLSDLSDYSTGVAVRPALQPVSPDYIPNTVPANALMRRGDNGLALSEYPTQRRERGQLNGLGELVQVVT